MMIKVTFDLLPKPVKEAIVKREGDMFIPDYAELRIVDQNIYDEDFKVIDVIRNLECYYEKSDEHTIYRGSIAPLRATKTLESFYQKMIEEQGS
jgi:hypothetical protein